MMMKKIHSPKLAGELAPLQKRIEEIKATRSSLEEELNRLETDLASLEDGRQHHIALQEVCAALRRLESLGAGELFWNELSGGASPGPILERLAGLSEQHQAKISAKLEKKGALQKQIEACSFELFCLDGEVYEAFLREQQRRDEFVIERDIPFFPMRAAVMPWSRETESERYFRRSVLVALLICFLVGVVVPLVNIPKPDRVSEVVVIPERLVTLVKKEPVIPETPPPSPDVEKDKEPDETKTAKKETDPVEEHDTEKSARKTVQNSGVLAFKDSFKDLIADAPAARPGARALIKDKEPLSGGSSSPRRSLVAMQATGTSGGINAAAVSRSIGSGGQGGNGERIGEVAFSRVESAVANLTEQGGRPLNSGPGPARTDEEIQIVFDRYKATLYRIYNKELRKHPTLKGNILLRITIEPDGAVSGCTVESTDLASPELVRKIVDRVERFNFGPKEDVQKITILYPIDFLPAG